MLLDVGGVKIYRLMFANFSLIVTSASHDS